MKCPSEFPKLPALPRELRETIRREQPALGTWISLTVGGLPTDEATRLTEEGLRELRRLERIFDAAERTSEIALWRRGETQRWSPELRWLIGYVGRESCLALLGPEFLARGFVVDRVYERLRRSAPRVTVDAGSDVRTSETVPAHLTAPNGLRYRALVTDGAVSTRCAAHCQARFAGATISAGTCTRAGALAGRVLHSGMVPECRWYRLYDSNGAVISLTSEDCVVC